MIGQYSSGFIFGRALFASWQIVFLLFGGRVLYFGVVLCFILNFGVVVMDGITTYCKVSLDMYWQPNVILS